jgi:Type IV secretion system pilin
MFNCMFNFLYNQIKRLLVFSTLCLVFLTFFGTITVSAADTSKDGLAGLQPSGIKCLFYIEAKKAECPKEKALTEILVSFLRQLAPAVTTLLIIFGGYEYFVDKEAKKTTAQATIFAAISGFVIITIAPVITTVITDTLKDEQKVFDSGPIIALLDKLINVLLDLSSVVAVAIIVLGGYAYFIQLFVNGGKQEGKLNARDLLFGGVMGLIVATLARPIVKFIQLTIGSTKEGALTLDVESIVKFVKNILGNFLIPFSSIVSLVFVIAAAYLWLTAGSDEDRVKNAKKFLNNALIGLVIVLLSTVIVQLIVFFVQPGISFIPGSPNANTILQGGTTPVVNP